MKKYLAAAALAFTPLTTQAQTPNSLWNELQAESQPMQEIEQSGLKNKFDVCARRVMNAVRRHDAQIRHFEGTYKGKPSIIIAAQSQRASAVYVHEKTLDNKEGGMIYVSVVRHGEEYRAEVEATHDAFLHRFSTDRSPQGEARDNVEGGGRLMLNSCLRGNPFPIPNNTFPVPPKSAEPTITIEQLNRWLMRNSSLNPVGPK